MIKNLFIITTVLALLSCNDNDEMDEILKRYETKHKSQNLIGFWQLEGFYPPDSLKKDTSIKISFDRYTFIEKEEFFYIDSEYLRLLKKSSNVNDSLYNYNSNNTFYWYNEGVFLRTLYYSGNTSSSFQNILEYQFPYKFGETKDTLIIQNNENILYLLKKINVNYK